MLELMVKPEIQSFDTVVAFAEQIQITDRDLIFTIEVIYEQYLKDILTTEKIFFFDQYAKEEPTDIVINQLIEMIDLNNYNRLIAIGGGACLDVAKIIAVSQGKDVDYLFDHKEELQKTVELILIPTTCGTGSEVTGIAAVNRTKLNTKMGLGSPAMYGDQAVLIPELIDQLPSYVFATSSIDALIHAVESYLSPNATTYSELFSIYAIRNIINSFLKITQEKHDKKEYSKQLLLASNAAGIAFSIGGCAAVHAMSYQLGGKYHVTHGESNYALFTGVLRYYKNKKPAGKIMMLETLLSELLKCNNTEVYDQLEMVFNQLLYKKKLHEYGVLESDLQDFAKSVVETQERLTKNNYIPLKESDYLEIFKALY